MTTASSARSAADPWLAGRAPHVPFGPGQLPSVCLLPGDPRRVSLAKTVIEDLEIVGDSREFRLATGSVSGVPVAVCSTGIGGPSTEIAVVELQRLGVRTFIRVGGMGAISPAIPPGTITYVRTALGGGGAAKFYAQDQVELNASPKVTSAIETAAHDVGTALTPITILSCDSYYLGQGRTLPGYEEEAKARFSKVIESGADGMDMETETVFAVAHALGCDYGSILIAHGNRATNEWLEDYEPAQMAMLRIAAGAVVKLANPGS